MLTFDHLKLVRRNPREMKRFRRWLMSMPAGQVAPGVNVVHEHDDSCCRVEPWNVTLVTIYRAVKPPTRMVAINLPPACR
jgi:hypothetical protein